jgi:phenylpropionate dioxygenase-like ring-hydroxylating dioxygenase large terminal subunit
MGMFDHWQPAVPSRSLPRQRVVGVRLGDKEIALFRTASGDVGALDEQCPHRRMRLSRGRVIGERLMCTYHGWTFGCDGMGESPGTPKMHACASTWDAREEHGFIWVKSKTSNPPFPTFDIAGWYNIGAMEHIAKAPLELTLDNFCEIEHTPMVHQFFGYKLDTMKDVTVHVESTEETTTVTNHGPPKPINFFLRCLMRIKKDFVFKDTWTSFFSPVYSVFDHMWLDPKTGEEAFVRWRVYVFFTPITEIETRLTSFAWVKSKWPFPPHGGLVPFRGFIRRRVERELAGDVEILSKLASYDTSIEGMKLSRFDKVLAMNRERIERIYRGNQVTKAESPMPLTTNMTERTLVHSQS